MAALAQANPESTLEYRNSANGSIAYFNFEKNPKKNMSLCRSDGSFNLRKENNFIPSLCVIFNAWRQEKKIITPTFTVVILVVKAFPVDWNQKATF